ncbi:MAG: glycosyltransferase [Candidatus Sumerlaeota bacterium]|nr:glycosyltransferase [Candidatus Sumerlaeota bacterium]
MTDQPLRILHFINTLGLGGAEKRLAEIVARLPREQFEFYVCCLSGLGPYEGIVRAAGASIEVLGYRRLRQEGRLRWTRLLEPLRIVRRLRETVARVRPDVVHTWIPICNFIGGRALARWRFRRVALIQSRVFTGEYRDANPFIPIAEGFAARRADLVYCNCEAVRDDVIRREPMLDPACLRVVRNGVDLRRFAPRLERPALRAKLGLAEDELAIVAVGALRAHKGHADLVHAARIVRDAHPRVRFLLVGPDQGEGPDLRALQDRLALGAAVEFLGPRDDVPDLLAAADVLALPSHEEGLPNVLLEAQACGLPCVATALPGCLEALAAGVTGFVVAPRHPHELAEAIRRLLSDPPLRRRMGEAARERAERSFSIETMLKQFASLYREAAGS